MKIQNDYISKQKDITHTIPRFRGSVSKEFIDYVELVRKDCLRTVPAPCQNLINNTCDHILTKAQRVMQNCFPSTSVLSVDTTTNPEYDFITYLNSVFHKLSPGVYNGSYIYKDKKPVQKLKELQKSIINGYCFAGSCAKEFTRLFWPAHYYKNKKSNLKNPELLKFGTELCEFWQNKIDLLKAETNAKGYCNLPNQENYTELITMLKEIE